MSKRAMQWADTVKIANGPMQQVLRALAYWHNDSAQLYPSQSKLATTTGLSERAVRYALQRLSYFGVIKRTVRSKGSSGRTSDLFVLSFGLHDINREQIAIAVKALRKPIFKRHHVPVVDEKLQPAPRAGGPGTACQGIGDEYKTLSHVSTELSKGQCTHETVEPTTGPILRMIVGGRQ